MPFQKLQTPWFDSVGEVPLAEYPRPQFARDSYFCLNGKWNYAISKKKDFPPVMDGQIVVPFSPECQLSGVERVLKPNEFLFYERKVTLPKNFNKGRVLLHFGAVDSFCEVFVDGKKVGEHSGGYNAFSFDVTESFCDNLEHTLSLRVVDTTDKGYQTHGKQSSKRGGMWYTPQSGIWQTVWMESVPKEYIENVVIIPLFDEKQVKITPITNFNEQVTAVIYDGENEVAKADGKGELIINFPNGEFTPWSPENPHLYTLTLVSRYDKVTSYFGMRKFGIEKVGKFYRTMLNNKPYFMNGLLDQGYFPDGLYTPPTDEAMVNDIATMKRLGFNMLRKHIKVEPMRWYYHCDRLGMLVWQDMPSGGTAQHLLATLILPFIGFNKMNDSNYAKFSRKSEESRKTYLKEYKEMISQLFNVVSLSTWVPFNEGWGQFDAKEVYKLTKELDSTRLVDHASGWHDQGCGDFNSKHIYMKKVHLPRDKNRAVILSEFGGYTYKETEHSFNISNTYSYKDFKSKQDFNNALAKLYKRDVIDQIKNGLTATVYTQVSDVEDEINGIFTYDRKVLKVDEEMMQKTNAEIKL